MTWTSYFGKAELNPRVRCAFGNVYNIFWHIFRRNRDRVFIRLHWLSRLCTSHSRKSFACSVITHQHCNSMSKLSNTQWYFDNHPEVFDKYSILLWQPLILPNSHFRILILLFFAFFVKSWCWCWPSQLRNEDWWRCHGAWHASLEHCQLGSQHILRLNPKNTIRFMTKIQLNE